MTQPEVNFLTGADAAPFPRDDPRRATFVAFDVETTGLVPPFARLVELAAVRFSLGSDSTISFAELIDPGRPIPPDVISIHSITDAMVRGAPAAPEVVNRFLTFCGPDAILVAHNAGFDASFLAVELRKSGVAEPPNLIIDTLKLSHALLSLSGYSLEKVARSLGVAARQAHRALPDATLVAGIVRRLAATHPALLRRGDLLRLAGAARLFEWAPAHDAQPPAGFEKMARAIRERLPVEVVYVDQNGRRSLRVIEPLFFTGAGRRAFLTAWCRLREGERTFRVDRIARYQVMEAPSRR
ncbi:MAG: WYL domain-containing protein [Planctomycetes bacterium]|nr:WYL domain-containing protein [Planctomycetota bacterium]